MGCQHGELSFPTTSTTTYITHLGGHLVAVLRDSLVMALGQFSQASCTGICCAGICCRDGSIAATRQEIRQQLGDGGLNLLVNNAGVGLVAPAEFVPLDQWRGVLDVNLQGPLAVTQVRPA
jgi:NAD(P)-dependent dehydrogenase (short-subunit alcohol dehydrogenase family)